MVEEKLSENIKKIIPWSNGLGIYITKEAKELGWKRNDHVRLIAVKENGKGKIIVERV